INKLKMNRYLFLIFIIIFFIQCNEKERASLTSKKEYFYPYYMDFDTIVEVKYFRNFNSLLLSIDTILCSRKTVIIKFENDSCIYKIKPINFCSKRHPIFDYSYNDIIYLSNDSIIVDIEIRYSLDSLESILEKHILNKNKDLNYPRKPNSGFLSVGVDSTKTITEIEKLFGKIFNVFNNLNRVNNDSLKLYLYFEYDYLNHPVEIKPPQ
ncbi:MAG: hypothetical protein KDC47_06780, partial [Flavobacteriaceae bacterium]|nr:hypothetical protein [Flavobacteriaceae bacterium]